MSGYVILGMHRTGTSLLAELIEQSGCSLGHPSALTGPSEENPHGFREHRDVVELNAGVLASLRCSWIDVLPLLDGAIDTTDRKEFHRQARRILSRIHRNGPWGFKDPRLALLFPLWRDLIDDPTVLIPVRHPAEVALSIHRRGDMSVELAASLWEAYMVAALKNTAGVNRHLVSHAGLLVDPESTMSTLLTAIDDAQLQLPSAEALDQIVDPGLHRSQVSTILDSSVVSDEQRTLFEALTSTTNPDELPEFELSESARATLGQWAEVRPAAVPLARPTSQAATGRRVAAVVQGCRLPVFQKSIDAMRTTWAASKHDDVDIFFTYGNACDDHEDELVDIEAAFGRPMPSVPDGEIRRYGDVLNVGCSDLISHQSDALLRKRLLSLRYLLERHEHDAFLLLCASSYVDQDVLSAHLQTVPLQQTFQGPAFVAGETGRALVSGSAMLLSRDLAQRLVDNAEVIITGAGYQYADDVALSDWIANHVSDTAPAKIAKRLEEGRPGTTDNTFIQPPVGMLDYRAMPEHQHRTVEGAYHYHFATDQPETMTAFHRRHLAGTSPGADVSVTEATIFIQIASYRDPELPRTIASALATAEHPDRLRFGICWQYDDTTFDDLEPYLDDSRFAVDEVYYVKSRGCTWARNQANALFNDEDYYLQIDAHMRFASRWDVDLIEMQRSIPAEKPVLTVYPPGFTTDGQGNDDVPEPGPIQVLALDNINERLQTRQCTKIAADQSTPGPSPFVAAGFLFAPGSFCRDVPYDPEGYFNGEEIALAVRGYSWGYDFFYPSKNLIWHRYDHGEPLHWADHSSKVQPAEERAMKRLSQLLLGDASQLGEFGLGPHRSVADYEAYAGIDFAAAARGERLAEPTHLSFDVNLDTSAIPQGPDYEVWVFSLLGNDERELLRQDIYDQEVLTGQSTQVRVEAEFDVKPTKYLLWPKSSVAGFGERIIRDLDVPSLATL